MFKAHPTLLKMQESQPHSRLKACILPRDSGGLRTYIYIRLIFWETVAYTGAKASGGSAEELPSNCGVSKMKIGKVTNNAEHEL